MDFILNNSGVLLLMLFILLILWVYFRASAYKGTDWGHPFLNWMDGLNRWFCVKYHRFNYESLNLSEDAGHVLIANHRSGLDPLLLIAASNRPVRFLIAQEQYQRPGVNRLCRWTGCIPVSRSSNPQKAFKSALQAIENNQVIGIFPHGTIIETDDLLENSKLKRGAFLLAQTSLVPLTVSWLEGIGAQGKNLTAILVRSNAQLKKVHTYSIKDDQQCDEVLSQVTKLYGHPLGPKQIG